MQRWQKIVGLVAVARQFWPGSGNAQAARATATADPVKVGIIYSRTGALAAYGAEYIQGLALRARVRDQGHGRGQRPDDRAHDRRRRGRPGQGRLGREGPDRQGLQDHRRQRLVRRRAADRAARRPEPGALHLRPGGDRRAHRGSTSTRSAPVARAIQDVLAASSFLGGGGGKNVTVFAQDSAFGHGNFARRQR